VTLIFLLFFGLVTALAVLPLLPAIREWRRPTDTAPLKVVQESAVDIRYFATSFRNWVRDHLSEAQAACRRTGAVEERTIDGTRCVVLPGASPRFLSDAEARASRLDRVVVSCGDLRLPDGLTVTKELCADGSVVGGSSCTYRAILAGGDISLGRHTHTLRWVHAGGTVRAGAASHALGRVSADGGIFLDAGSRFERLRAPRVVFGQRAPELTRAPARDLPLLEPAQIRQGVTIEVGAGRWLIKGSVEIPPNVRVESHLVVVGTCRVRRGVVLAGSVKSHAELVLEEDVEILGSVVGQGDLLVGPRCRIHGPVVAERAARLAEGVIIGQPDELTTVTALDLTVEPGVVVHGTVWAHRRGDVAVPAAARTNARGAA
jgi:predicted acyltransferase (DUF342 family)